MVSKTHYKSPDSQKFSKGFTLLELTIATTLGVILLAVLIFVINPVEMAKRGRDGQRINDLSVLERIIEEYHVDTGNYPDTESTFRFSNVLPTGASALNVNRNGWILADFRSYNGKLPADPLNTDVYRYTYYHDATTFELNARLEHQLSTMSSDGGNDSNLYEVGNNLNLISP